MESTGTALLKVDHLTVERAAEMGERDIGLRRVSIELSAGEILVLAGESGSGNSLLARFIAGAAGPQAKRLAGAVTFDGRELTGMRPRDLQQLRRGPVALITGDAAGQYNPDRTVRQWFRDTTRLARRSGELADERTWGDYFYGVGIVEPEDVLPLPMGGLPAMLAKRLLLLKAIVSRSRLLICDEAKSDLDRISEMQFLELLSRIREEYRPALLVTTGRLRGLDRFADRVAVFFEGGILETGSARKILENPAYAYTREFLACEPRLADLPRELPAISREAAKEAEEAIHQGAGSSLERPTG